MTKFDLVMEELKSRVTTRRERYPSNINLSDEFLSALDAEYDKHYVVGNRNVHSNFLKAISFEIDRMRDVKKNEVPIESDIEVHDIQDEDIIDLPFIVPAD